MSYQMSCWSPQQRANHSTWRHRSLPSDPTGDDHAAMWTYNFLRTKHFHGVSYANPHVYSLTSHYGKVRPLLYLVHPGTMHRRKMKHKAWMLAQPGLHLLALM